MTFRALQALDFKGWIHQLLSATISGGASAISSGFAASLLDPGHFGLSMETFKLMAMTFSIAAILALMAFLAKNPVPPIIDSRLAEELKGKLQLLQEQADWNKQELYGQSHGHRRMLEDAILETKAVVEETKAVAIGAKNASERAEHESAEAREASHKAEVAANDVNAKIVRVGIDLLGEKRLKEKD